MRSFCDICYGKAGHEMQKLDIHLPEADSFPVFVYFHGGGLIRGDKGRFSELVRYLTENGIAIVSANYRMYPTAAYPDFLKDAAEAVAWVFQNIHTYGSAKGIFVGGSSAGGFLSQMLCFDKSWLAEYGIAPTDVAGFVHDAGQPTCHFNVLKERGIDSRRVIVDESAPLYHVGADSEYPPMLIIVSDDDMENRYEQTILLVSTLKHFGHTDNVQLHVARGKHCAYVQAVDEQGDSVFGQLVQGFIGTTQR